MRGFFPTRASSEVGASLELQGCELTIEFFKSVRELLFPCSVFSSRTLPIELDPREAQGLGAAHELGVDPFAPTLGEALALLLALFHLFGDTRLCVNQTFTSITHTCIISGALPTSDVDSAGGATK